eukprot:2624988-Rhodomonas_salina.1
MTTPTFWLWSFRLKKPVRLEGPRFSRHLYPFRNPSVIVNSGHLSAADIAKMHADDDDIESLFPDIPEVNADSGDG